MVKTLWGSNYFCETVECEQLSEVPAAVCADKLNTSNPDALHKQQSTIGMAETESFSDVGVRFPK